MYTYDLNLFKPSWTSLRDQVFVAPPVPESEDNGDDEDGPVKIIPAVVPPGALGTPTCIAAGGLNQLAPSGNTLPLTSESFTAASSASRKPNCFHSKPIICYICI